MNSKYFNNSFSEEIWRITYKDHKDNDVTDTWYRVANAIASVEKTPELRKEWREKFYDMLEGFKVTPGGRITANAGAEWSGTTLANCFVLPNPTNPVDSLAGILEQLNYFTTTLKSEGGCGFDLKARPRSAFIEGIGVESPGSVKFLELFDKGSEIITSGSGSNSSNKRAKGKIRKGASLATLNINSPDIIEFITAKQTPGRLTKFNLSVTVTNEFMDRLINIISLKDNNQPYEHLDDWDLWFPDTTFEKYNSEWDGDYALWKAKGYPYIVYQTVSVLWLWDLIMKSTYNRAEPGVLFMDRANELNPFNYGEKIFATNPCGEQFLPAGGVCNLSSINLTQFISDDGKSFNYDKFIYYIHIAVRFLDNVNDYANTPLPEYKHAMVNKRRIGLGILGWGSLLIMLKIPFGSEKAKALQENIMTTLSHNIIKASVELAKEKGMFPLCDPEKQAEAKYYKNIGLSQYIIDDIKVHGIRNAVTTSIQPTGNNSVYLNNVSSGIEPLFMTEYIRTSIVPVPDHLKDSVPKFWEGVYEENDMFKWVKEGDDDILRGIDSSGTVYKIDRNRGFTKETLIEDYGVKWLKDRNDYNPLADYVVTSDKITGEQHLEDLKGFARFIDSSISKTVNIPNEYPYEDFKNLYIDAYKSGYIKGITTYRSGTMASVLSSTTTDNGKCPEEIILEDVKLPDSAPASVKILRAENRKWYLTCVYHPDDQRPIAFFAHTNSPEKTIQTHDAIERLINLARTKGIPDNHIETTLRKIQVDNNVSKICRAISLLLRHGVLIKNVVNEIDKIDNVFVGSFLFQIKKYLSSYIRNGEKVDEECNNCGSKNSMVYQDGCKTCSQCGNAKCG